LNPDGTLRPFVTVPSGRLKGGKEPTVKPLPPKPATHEHDCLCNLCHRKPPKRRKPDDSLLSYERCPMSILPLAVATIIGAFAPPLTSCGGRNPTQPLGSGGTLQPSRHASHTLVRSP
jgi:hypothetical protein